MGIGGPHRPLDEAQDSGQKSGEEPRPNRGHLESLEQDMFVVKRPMQE